MSNVVRLADLDENQLKSAAGRVPLARFRAHADFTLRDRADLEAWAALDRRVVLCSSDLGGFAMLHQDGVPWASWGVVRQGRTVLLWDCVTHADIGQFPNMLEALRAVPITGQTVSVPAVLCFAAVSQPCQVSI